MPLFKKLLSILTACVVIMTMGMPALANARFERFEMMWNDATDAERYFMPSEVKAYACGLSTNDFVFFARVIEGEGADNDDNITDKVFVALTVLNRMACSRWPTRSSSGAISSSLPVRRPCLTRSKRVLTMSSSS